jgi:hypothetical protein
MSRINIVGGGMGLLGEVRYEVERATIKAAATERLRRSRDFDPDRDVSYEVEHHAELARAMKRAQEIYDQDEVEPSRSAFGSVTIRTQRLECSELRSELGEWVDTGELREVTSANDYRNWANAQLHELV